MYILTYSLYLIINKNNINVTAIYIKKMYNLHSLFLIIILFIQKLTYYVHSESKYDQFLNFF